MRATGLCAHWSKEVPPWKETTHGERRMAIINTLVWRTCLECGDDSFGTACRIQYDKGSSVWAPNIVYVKQHVLHSISTVLLYYLWKRKKRKTGFTPIVIIPDLNFLQLQVVSCRRCPAGFLMIFSCNNNGGKRLRFQASFGSPLIFEPELTGSHYHCLLLMQKYKQKGVWQQSCSPEWAHIRGVSFLCIHWNNY